MTQKREKVGVTIKSGDGKEIAFDSIEEFAKAGKRLIKNLREARRNKDKKRDR